MESHGGKINGNDETPTWPFSASSPPSFFCPQDRRQGLPRFQSNSHRWPPSTAIQCNAENQQQIGSSHRWKKIVKNFPIKSKLYSSQWAQWSWHWFGSSIFVPLGGKAGQRRHIKFVQWVSVEFSLTETVKRNNFNSRQNKWEN
jgi:hypothetical protein